MPAQKERPNPSLKAERRAVPRKPSVKPAQTSAKVQVSPDEIRRLIAEAAYFRAEGRGFAPGYELEDWVQAEAEIRQRLTGAPQ